MKNHDKQRNIYPFGNSDQHATNNLQDYWLDCSTFDNPHTLENTIRDQWKDKGLVVLGNTGMKHLSELEHWGSIVFKDFTSYEGGSAPRSKWSDKVFGIDDTPSHIDMCYHNEACYLPTFPRCFLLGSLSCPVEGGATMVSDNVATTNALLATSLGQALQAKGIRYIRNMTDKHTEETVAYKHWQDTFYTDSREEVEDYIKAQEWDYTWLPNGTLRTSYVVDAFEYHEQLDRNLYFAGLVSHAAFFDQWPPFNTLPDEERPFTMTLGDGTLLSDEDITQLYSAYNQVSLPVSWQHADLAILDNLRWSHARPAFNLKEGESRVMGVTMGMMQDRVGNHF